MRNLSSLVCMIASAAAAATLVVACSSSTTKPPANPSAVGSPATTQTSAGAGEAVINNAPGAKSADAHSSAESAEAAWFGVVPQAANATSVIPARRDFPVNLNANPCQDFYQYACSDVMSTFKLRPDRSFHDFAFSDSAERILTARQEFFKNIDKDKDLGARGKQLQDSYMACMDESSSKNEELDYNKKLVKSLANINKHELFEGFLEEKILSGDTAFVDFGITSNQDDPNKYDAMMLATIQDLPERSYYDNTDLMKGYTDLIADTLKTLGADLSAADADVRAAKVVAFEKAFAQTYPLPAEFRQLFVTRTKISKSQLLSRYPNLGFGPILAKIPDKTLIRDLTPKNFEFLNNALAKEDLQTLKDTYLVKAAIMDDAYPDNFNKWFAFRHKFLGGPSQRSVRQERCTKKVSGAFDKEADFVLLPRLFPSFPEDQFRQMAERIRASIIEGIEKAQWISPAAKKVAQDKMKVAPLQLVKPRNDKEWDFNPMATYSRTHQYANARLLGKNLKMKDLGRLKEKRDRMIWEMSPLTINAYYSPPDNKFVMPIGILQYPFYDKNMSLAEQFGAAGTVIGHELGHGIDDKGSLYDAKGRLHEWFSKTDMSHFKALGEKLGKQFADAGQNPELTMGENMGDLVGVSASYRAMFEDGKATIEDKKAYFLAYARVWCQVRGAGVKELRLKTDPHSLGENRVNQQIKQQPGFAEAFQCKEGDPMVLKAADRVVIW